MNILIKQQPVSALSLGQHQAITLQESEYIWLLTYLLNPLRTVLLEKLTSLQLVKEFPTFYGIRTFIKAFTSARHLSLSWAKWIQSLPPHRPSWRSILILFSHLRLGLPGGLFPAGFPTKALCAPLLSPYSLHAPPISFFSILSSAKYFVKSADHWSPHNIVFSSPC